MFGWRARIGVIIPSANTTVEGELNRVVPEGVSVHAARARSTAITVEGMRAMAEHAGRAAAELEDASVDVIVYACTSGTFTQSPTFDRDLQDRLSDATGIPVVTTTTAVVAALRTLSAQSVVLATPYDDAVNELEVGMLRHHGIEVRDRLGLGHVQPAPQPPLRPRRASPIGVEPAYVSYAIARRLHEGGATDAIFVSCTNLRTFEIIAALEKDTGVSVVSSNQASLWAALALAGVAPALPGLGALLERGDRLEAIEALHGVHVAHAA